MCILVVSLLNFVFDEERAGMARINSIHSSFKAMGYYIRSLRIETKVVSVVYWFWGRAFYKIS